MSGVSLALLGYLLALGAVILTGKGILLCGSDF